MPRGLDVKDMIGQHCGRLTVIERGANFGKRAGWLCVCDCGKNVTVDGAKLRSGHTTSCGCAGRENRARAASKACRTHGMTGTPTFAIWGGMLSRCYNAKVINFHYYGGRGVTVCDRWRDGFENFLADMGERPPGLSLDRIDNDLPYEPGNCKWSTAKEQANNRRPPRRRRAA